MQLEIIAPRRKVPITVVYNNLSVSKTSAFTHAECAHMVINAAEQRHHRVPQCLLHFDIYLPPTIFGDNRNIVQSYGA